LAAVGIGLLPKNVQEKKDIQISILKETRHKWKKLKSPAELTHALINLQMLKGFKGLHEQLTFLCLEKQMVHKMESILCLLLTRSGNGPSEIS
jgi:hypothetical protein